MRRPIALAFAALLLPASAAAQSISASVDRTNVSVGENVALTIEIEGRGASRALVDPPDARRLTLQGATPVLRSMTSINGRATLTLRWIYRATTAGEGRIGPARVVVGGRVLLTDPITVAIAPGARAVGPPAPEADASEGELYVRAVARPARPFVGQQVVVDYILYFRGHLEPRSAQFVGAWQAEGLWREELDVPPAARSPRPAGNGFWSVLVRRVALYPTRSGSVRLGELTFEIELLRRQEDPFGFFGAFSSRFERASPIAPAVVLSARALPAGAPAGFGGAVGQFAIRAGLDRDAADIGDPLQLTAVVEGDGNLATLMPPVVDAPASFERYEPSEDRTLDRSSAPATGRKTFAWSMVPRSGGQFDVGVQLAFFDPVAEQYRSLAIPPLDVAVSGAVDPVAAAIDGPAPAMAATGWTRPPDGRPRPLWLIAAGVLPLIALGWLAAGARVRLPRRRTAPSPLAAAEASVDDAVAFYTALRVAVHDGDAEGRLPEERRPAANALQNRIDEALYSRGGPPPLTDRERDLKAARNLLQP